MLVAEILRSCTDAGVAEAAVASIGGDFAARVRAEAAGSGLSVGAFTGSLVARFAIDAGERDWRDLAARMVGADHPVLSGIEAMVERMLASRAPIPTRKPPPASRVVPTFVAALRCGA